RRVAHRSTLSLPARTIFMTSSVAASVTRRPAIWVVVRPRRFWRSVACGPPPWTIAMRAPPSTRTRRSAARIAASGELMPSPPILTTMGRGAVIGDSLAPRGAGLPRSDDRARSRPVPDVFERGALVAAEQEVHVLDRLAGAALDEVVDGGEA